MPSYDYHCPANGQTVTVTHPMDRRLTTWGEVCYVSGHPMGETEFLEPVERLISAPAVVVPTGNSELKSMGFTKLVKRDDGVYENVTRGDKESRYMTAGDASSQPDLAKRIKD